MNDKFELLTENYIQVTNPDTGLPIKLYRIIALKDFGDVKEGQTGGFIQQLSNLSADDDSWVYNNAKIFGSAIVSKNSEIRDSAAVYGNAVVESSTIKDTAAIYGNAKLLSSVVSGKADVCGNSRLVDSLIMNAAKIDKTAAIFTSTIKGGSHVSDNSILKSCTIDGVSRVYGSSKLTNCNLSGAVVVRDEEHQDTTLSKEIDLQVEVGGFEQ